VGEEVLGYDEYNRGFRDKLREDISGPYMKMSGIAA
jgi:hypothetical protein